MQGMQPMGMGGAMGSSGPFGGPGDMGDIPPTGMSGSMGGAMPGTLPPTTMPSAMVPGFEPQEQGLYAQLWAMADPQGLGVIDATSAAKFLRGSGLSDEILYEIWNHSDQDGHGILNMQGFFVALRLVGHAQAGNMPLQPQMVSMPPPRAPDFPSLGRPCSNHSGSRAASLVRDNASDLSELQPVIGSHEAAEVARQASRGASPMGRGSHGQLPLHWAPTVRERRKYATLFLKSDLNGDGIVETDEMQALAVRSQLPAHLLSTAWDHADRDESGRFDFPKFVILVHLITCLKLGGQPPPLEQGLPQELQQAIMTLERPEELQQQRSRSASRNRSASPAPAGDFGGMNSGFPDAGASGWGQDNTAAFGGGVDQTGFGPQTSSYGEDAFGPSAGSHGGGTFDAGFDAPSSHPGTRRHGRKTRSRDRQEWSDPYSGAGAPDTFVQTLGPSHSDALGPEPLDRNGGRSSSADRRRREGRLRQPEDNEMSLGVPEFDPRGTSQQLGGRYDERSWREDLSSAMQQSEAIVEADRAVTKQLKRDVDELEQELRHVHETRDQLDRQLRQESDEGERLRGQQRQLERQMEGLRQRLVDLREERRAVNLESISLRRDREHFAEELAFLQRMSEEEESTLESLRRSNAYLEKSYKSLEAHTQQLELQRKEVIRQVQEERDAAKHEERQNAEMRNQLERMRREHVAAAQGRRDAQFREQRLRQLQDEGPMVPQDVRRPVDPRRPEGHSWAGSLGRGLPRSGDRGPEPGMRADGFTSTQPPYGMGPQQVGLTVGPINREGV